MYLIGILATNRACWLRNDTLYKRTVNCRKKDATKYIEFQYSATTFLNIRSPKKRKDWCSNITLQTDCSQTNNVTTGMYPGLRVPPTQLGPITGRTGKKAEWNISNTVIRAFG